MNRGRYPRHIIEMALRIRDKGGVENPKQVADLIAEKTNDGYRPSGKQVRRWLRRYPEPLGSKLNRLRTLAQLDSLPPSFREVKLVRKEGRWSQVITLLKRDAAGVLQPMAPGVYRNADQYRTDLKAMTKEWYQAAGHRPPKYNLITITVRYLLGESYREIAEAYAKTEGQRISASTVRRLLKRQRSELPHGRGPHHPAKEASEGAP